jgi:hypothetical protein
MKRIPRVFPACLALLPICLMSACSEPERHILNINLKNDLGKRAELSLCKDDLHCGSVSEQWIPKQIDAQATLSFTVSNEETTVFKVSYEIDGKTEVRCLRIRRDESRKPVHDVLLSSAAAC